MTQSDDDRETGTRFLPRFDANGLLTAVVTDAETRTVLMVAFMNQEALDLTQATGIAHFWSRSRQQLWKKGETSGHVLTVRELLVDCDQDALVIVAEPAGPACHTGAVSCFYRRVSGDALERITD
jgi:phosphoribosyl-AMP cyclohydrolase